MAGLPIGARDDVDEADHVSVDVLVDELLLARVAALGDGRPQPPGQHDEYPVRGVALAVQRLPALDVDPVEGEVDLDHGHEVV